MQFFQPDSSEVLPFICSCVLYSEMKLLAVFFVFTYDANVNVLLFSDVLCTML